MILIGIHGLAGSGKDTSARFMADHAASGLGLPCRTYAFAEPIKLMLSVGLGIPLDNFHDRDIKEAPSIYGPTHRELMTIIGTDAVRNMINKDAWGIRAQIEIDKHKDERGVMFVTDVRFENEADLIRGANGVVVHIQRPGLVGSGHESEAGVKAQDGDYVIVNDGGLDELRSKSRGVVSLIAGPHAVA